MDILGIKISEVTKQQALEKTKEFLLSNTSHKIFTPNPEMVVDAQKDFDFKNVLNSGDMNLCDGFGLCLASGFKLKRYSGVSFMTDLCALAEKENKSIYLLGSGSDEVIKKTAKVLQEKYPMLKIVGWNKGLVINKNGEYNKEENEDLIYDIIIKSPDILFVAFGHGKQEKWIDKNLVDLPSVKIAMGVGGSFDFISGKVKRAPKLFRFTGLEWLWRLILQPWRFKRIWKATVKFSYLFIKNHLC